MINELIELKLIKKQLIVLTAADLKLKSADEELFEDFSSVTWNQLLDLFDRAMQLLDIKITDKITDEEINQIINILADYELANYMFIDENVNSASVIKQLRINLESILFNYRDSYRDN